MSTVDSINKLSMLDLIIQVLTTSGTRMTGQELWDAMQALGRTSKGATPVATVKSVAYTNIASHEDSRLFRDDNSQFGLVEWLSDDDKGVWALRHKDIMNHYALKTADKPTTKAMKHEIDLTLCQSYNDIFDLLADTADEELSDLQTRLDAYITNTKKYMKATNRITLEYTKSAIILPFIQLLGYSVFNPDEVLPNRVARDNHQIDYTIYDYYGKVRFTVSCLALNEPLDKKHWEELRDTFLGTKDSIALLTNGIDYHIYTTADKSGTLNEVPIASFNILEDTDLLLYLIYLGKSRFSIKGIANKALSNAIVNVLIANFNEPSDDFISFIVKQLGAKSTKSIRTLSKQAVKQALNVIRTSKETDNGSNE